MIQDKDDRLRETIKARLVDAKNHLEALEYNTRQVGDDFSSTRFRAAWESPAASEGRSRAYAVEGSCESFVDGVFEAAQEICALQGWTRSVGLKQTKLELLQQLRKNGVITEPVRREMADKIAGYRDTRTHDYVKVNARELHAHVVAVLTHGPAFLTALSKAF